MIVRHFQTMLCPMRGGRRPTPIAATRPGRQVAAPASRRRRRLVLTVCAALVWQTQAQTVRVVPTFNNLGIEVSLTTPPPGGTTVAMSSRKTNASGPLWPGHPLVRLSNTLYAGSLFELDSGTEYEIQLQSAAFSSNLLVRTATRQDSFRDATNRVLHVSAVSGNDTNSGLSHAQALRTVGRVIALAQAGDKVLLHEGRYYEGDLTLPRSGSASSPIVLENAPGETAVLDGTDVSFTPVWSEFDAALHLYRTPCSVMPENAYLNGEHFFHYLSLEDLRTNRWEQGSGYFADGSHLYARFPGDVPPGTNRLTLPRFTTGLTLDYRHDIHVRGLEFCYYGLGTYHRGIYINGGASNLVDRCRFHHSVIGVALKRAANFNTIQDCDFYESPLSQWSWHAVKSGGVGYEAGGVVVYGSSEPNEGNVIRFNRFTNLFDGAHLYSNASGPTKHLDFHHNRISGCADDGIETDGAGSNVRIYGNCLEDFLTGISVAPCAMGPTYIFRNVLSGWHNVAEYEGYPFKFNVTSSLNIEWVYLYHNTCSTDATGQNGFLFKQYSRWTNVVSRNNIFAGTRYALESWSGINPVDFDYDDLFTTDPSRFLRWAGVAYSSLSDFSQATGLETHGLSVPPAFLDPSHGDFYLRSDSPVVDRGCLIPGINSAFLGAAPDVGACEQGMEAVSVSVKDDMLTTRWNVSPGQIYEWQRCTNLATAPWISSGTITALASGIEFSATVPASSQSFYRLRRVAAFP